ncbi:DUF4388 domain-containing protein [Desulfogranum mediterraneum]|uniref:DUF4388 domain-containing protein n=1 Tax=Desulfogranum mediterraneum TaxID=160661 RepID=UPI0013782814|nr:DUF4388 domain-containing protein [Desulfogranum mediterraneum]
MKTFFRDLFTMRSPESSKGAATEPAPADSMGKVALQGDISAISLDDIFQLFDFASLSGELQIVAPDNRGYFFVQKGRLIFGILDTRQQRLGELLMGQGRINRSQLEECLALHRAEGKQQRLGQFLIAKGYLSQDELSAALIRQVKEAFFEALSWREGTFSFHLDQTPGDEEFLLRERIDSLLLEGMLHIDEKG